jgi:glycosyltransferase involved in cell wall biosynthesis
VWTMSELDRDRAVAEGSPRARTFSVPNGVDLRRFAGAPKTTACDEIFYVGSFRHRPNYLGFEELRGTIMPAVWRDFPEARLNVVAGPDHLKHWPGSKQLDPRIVVHGFVEDLLPHYREASLVVVPLPVSAGTNIKLMEALGCERAVVTTPVGSAGLELMDGFDALIRDLGLPFADAICDLLKDPAKRARIAARGRQTATERFSWESIAAKAYECYESMLAGKSCA